MSDKPTLNQEQLDAIKIGLKLQLEGSLNYRGVRDFKTGKPVIKFAFLTKRQVRKIKWQRTYILPNGQKVHIRVF